LLKPTANGQEVGMTNLTIRISNLLRTRLIATAGKERVSISELVRVLLNDSLDRRQAGGGDPVTMADLKKLERLFVAIFATEQMVVRSLDPHRSLLPLAGKKAMELTAEMLGTKRS